MTERLSTLLHDGGRPDWTSRCPRRRPCSPVAGPCAAAVESTTALATVAVLAVIGGSVAVALASPVTTGRTDPLPAGGFGSTGAFSVGQKLYIGGQEIDWDEPIKTLYYTSAGVVVRSGAQEATDSAGPSHFTLVEPDGSRTPVEIDAGDRILGFEPDSTHVAYAEPNGPSWDVVVKDVKTGEELGRQTIAGTFTWGGWEAPPVAIDGDWVWVHFDDGWTEVAWADGAIRLDATTENTYEVANGHYADWNSRNDLWTIRRMSNHTKVADVQLEKGWYAFFSPDGNYLNAFPNDVEKEPAVSTIIYDARTGEQRAVPDASESLGWTPDGHTLEVEDDEIRICGAIDGGCIDLSLRPRQGVREGRRDVVRVLTGSPGLKEFLPDLSRIRVGGVDEG